MKNTFLLTTILFAGAMTADASVIYSFQACCGGTAQFQYTAPSFLSSPVNIAINIPVASLDSCSASFPCTSIDFFPSGKSADDAADHPEFVLNTSFGSLKEFFPFGSFGAAGVYLGAAGTPLNTPSDTLRVTVTGTATPEPTTLSLFGAGLIGLLGKMIQQAHRRQRAGSARREVAAEFSRRASARVDVHLAIAE